MVINKDNYIDEIVPIIIGDWFNAYGLILSFAEESIEPILLCYSDCFPMKSKHIAFTRIIEGAKNEEAFIACLCDCGKEIYPARGMLFPTQDEEVLAIAKYAERLKEYYEIPFSNYETCIQILDKNNFAQICKSLNVPTITGELVHNISSARLFAREHGYPIMIKPVIWNKDLMNALKGKNQIAFDESQFEQYIERIFVENLDRQILLQEFIPDSNIPMPTVKSFGDSGGDLHFIYIAEKLRQYPPRKGGSTAMITVDPREKKYESIIEYTSRIERRFKFYGLFGIEYKFDDRIKDYRVVEMNIRSEQLNYLPSLCGQNAAYQIYRFHLGKSVSIPFFPPITTGTSLVPFWDGFLSIWINSFLYPEYAISYRKWKTGRCAPVTYYGLSLQDWKPFIKFYCSLGPIVIGSVVRKVVRFLGRVFSM